jgi:hypothetical protein
MIRMKSRRGKSRLAAIAMIWCAALWGAVPASAQLNTRLLLTSGMEVPGHSGLAFGPFLSLAMNGNQDIVFLTSLRSPREEMRAVVRSTGIGFTVVAFQGLLGPFPHTTYETFSAPHINDAGVIAFTAKLATDQASVPKVVVVRQVGGKARAIATDLDAPPGIADGKFEEFSDPLVTSDGSVLFGGRWSGKPRGSGLFLWTSHGLQALPLPAGLQLGARELLEPFFSGSDEAAFLRRGTSAEVATDQFFRAIAIQSFQGLQPPPDPGDSAELLAARSGAPRVPMLLVFFENGTLQTAFVAGDPSKPVLAKHSPGATPLQPVGKIVSLTFGSRGHMIFAATPVGAPNDLSLYCDCDGESNRLTTPEDFLPITAAGPGKPILWLTGGAQQTVAFIAPGASGENTAIYVTDIR